MSTAKKYICAHCGVEFESNKGCKSRTPKFCSSACYGKSIEIHKACSFCGKEIPTNGGRKVARQFCGNKCRTDARRNTTLSPEWRTALSEGRKNSEKCKGKNLYNWKGGYENTMIRNKINYHRRRSSGKLDFTYLSILLKIQKNKCFYCGEVLKPGKHTAIEHLIPVSKGGTNKWTNLVYSCLPCNSQKHDSTLTEYAIKKNRIDWLNNPVQLIANKIATLHGVS